MLTLKIKGLEKAGKGCSGTVREEDGIYWFGKVSLTCNYNFISNKIRDEII